VYRRSSLSNEGDRIALLENEEYLVFPEEPVLEGRTWVAEYPDKGVVGLATIEQHPRTAELVDLFVDPASMRQGVGRALILHVLDILADNGITVLEVTANTHALAFYGAMGFQVIDTAATPLGSGLRMRLGGAEGS
jgi:ribosomal protein S18 acetylase RimI-like enzyme